MRRWVLVVALAGAAFLGCSSSDDDAAGGGTGGGGTGEVSGGGDDASAELACRDFRHVAADANAGLIAGYELRGKIQMIYDNARYSSDAEIRSQGEAMLRAATAGDDGALGRAIGRFDAACLSYTDLG